jgi:hypothetical protein
MAMDGVTTEAGVAGSPWTDRRWAPWVAAAVALLLVAAPARVWLRAAFVSAGDASVPGSLRLLWTFAGVLPAIVGVIAWRVFRSRPTGPRFVLSAAWACCAGLLTMLPITLFVFAV